MSETHATLDLVGLAFETERLTVRHWRGGTENPIERGGFLQALNGLLTDDVLKDLPASMQLDDTPEAVSNWVDARARESDCLSVKRSTNGALLGLLILVDTGASIPMPTLHLGYMFARHAWGQGLATELLAGLIASVATWAPLRLVGGVSKANPASARVLEKLGFSLVPELSFGDTEMFERIVERGKS